jgi:hypothetical protein
LGFLQQYRGLLTLSVLLLLINEDFILHSI